MADDPIADKDVFELLLQDHEEIRTLFGRLEETPAGERAALFDTIVHELARHEAAEEAIVHPTLRDEVPGGERVVEAILAEESEAENLMARMEDMDAESPEFLTAFRRLRDDVLAHAQHEQDAEWPQLRERLDHERLTAMADGVEQLKQVAPTRPHPHTPQTPEVRAVVGPVAGLFDRARDAARKVLAR